MRLVCLLGCLLTAACSAAAPSRSDPSTTSAVDARIAQFAPVDLTVDVQSFPANERQALARMIDAARLMDGLFLEQVWAGNAAMLNVLSSDSSPAGRSELRYFVINKGPWDRLDHNQPFVTGAAAALLPAEKPPQASFYPADATKAEIEQWIAALPERAAAEATGFFTVIRRGPDRRLLAMPYSVAYQNTLIEAAALLRQAAALTAQPTLKTYLAARAEAFLTNDYYASDVAWMELDASIEPTIGPYETYEDGWFGYKAAFEAFIAVRDDAETAKLANFSSELQGIEDALPIDPAYRNPRLAALAPIRVVNLLFGAGDANRGVQTAAFALPNDDRVIHEKGAKRVMLRNVQQAKFEKVLQPIAGVALAEADRGHVSFDAFFTHILMHELMHGLGPHQVAGTTQPVRLALRDTYAAIEEAKADVSGLWALARLADQGKVPREVADTMYTTFLASAFRSIRFGINEAHGRGIALQLNHLLDQGAVVVNPDGTFAVVHSAMGDAVTSLTRDLMTIQAQGDYAAAGALLARMVEVRPDVQRVLDRLAGVPVDIAPSFVTAAALAAP